MSNKRRKLTHIRDANGKRVTQLDPLELKLLHKYDIIDRDALTKILEEIGPSLDKPSRRSLPVLYFVVIVTGIMLIVRAIDAIVSNDLSIFLHRKSAFIGIMWLVILVFWYTAKESRFGKVRQAILNHHRCPHCGYNLRDLEPDPTTNHTTCPECDAAWSIPQTSSR